MMGVQWSGLTPAFALAVRVLLGHLEVQWSSDPHSVQGMPVFILVGDSLSGNVTGAAKPVVAWAALAVPLAVH